MKLDTAWLSQAGGRKTNQDHCGFASDESGGCWVVADGLGGHAGGETASRVAVDAVLQQLGGKTAVSAATLTEAFAAAQQAVHAEAAREPSLAGMRTTLVVLACRHDIALWGHVGDSRLYWFRQGKILRQTSDHSVPQMLVDAGKLSPADIRGHEDQNRLTRALGAAGAVKPTLTETGIDWQAGDAALLCSDGIWTWVLEAEMEKELQQAASARAWLAALEQRVLERATGPYDNYTAVAVVFSRSGQT